MVKKYTISPTAGKLWFVFLVPVIKHNLTVLNGVTPNCLPSKKATQKRLLYKVYSIKATQKSLLKKGYIDKKGYLIK